MITETIAALTISLIGSLGFRHLNGRINRTEDKTDEHFKCLDQKVSKQGEDIAVVKAVVERIEKKI